MNRVTNSRTGATDMSKVNWMWLVLTVIYAAFFSWYTSFDGPLTEKEIQHYKEL